MTRESFNIASLLTEAAGRWPDRLAVVASHRPDVLGRERLSYRELDESSSVLAAELVKGDVPPGSRIIVMVRPGLDFVIIVFGLFKAGLVPVMVDPGMGLKRMLRCLAEGRPSGIVGLPVAHLLSLTAPVYFRGIKVRVTVGRRWGWGGRTFAKIMKGAVAPEPKPGPDGRAEAGPGPQFKLPPLPLPTGADDMAALLFTSGSTGPAKGVVYTHAMFRAQVEAISQGLGLRPGGIDLATFPLFGLFAPALGLTSIIPDINPGRPGRADPRRIVSPIIKYNVTSMFASPTLLDKVSRFAHEHRLSLPSLRLVISAGAPVSPRVAAAFASLISGEARLLTPYGATEGVPLTIIDAGEISRETKLMTEQGLGMCVGRPLPGVHLGIIRIKDGAIERWKDELRLPMGEIGEIIARGPMVSAQYFERPRDTALSVIPDPGASPEGFWRRMGDVGWMDAEGRLWFCGRKAHRVVTEQGTLFSIPCEAIFNNHPQVRRSALVGVGPLGRQKPVIIIEPHSSLKSPSWSALIEELGALAKANPRTIHISSFLKCRSFPVDVRHNAKINREKLAIWAVRGLMTPAR
ncbi:MAG: AMP-binding protein [Candidatus Adiutrix sp.]|jgi:acyl-CoA synthetase (AMP-forming)/AMP-acid ligase II|nr:AMP-binding protein [Candidatus Adiutrix sp.]